MHSSGGGGSTIRQSRDRTVAQRRALALGAIAVVLLGGVVFIASSVLGPSAAEKTATRFALLWEKGQYADMWAMLTPDSQRSISAAEFASKYQDAARTATSKGVKAYRGEEKGGLVTLPVVMDTRVWGPVRGNVSIPVEDEHVVWSPEMVFPGMREGEVLTRDTKAPTRAPNMDRKGDPLVEGDASSRTSSLGSLAGTVGAPEDQSYRDSLYAKGFPEGQPAGVSGLELVFEDEVQGTPGGTLRSGTRQLAVAEPVEAEPARTTLDPGLQEAAASGLADRIGGIVVLDARSGEVRAVAGGGISDAQPPGSTFKIVTAAAALDSGVAKMDSEYPVAGFAVIDGFKLQNAHDGELCGGTFVESFAHSCNSVFAPIGADVGADKLVDMAERFGINETPSIPGATESTMPKASEFTSDLDVGATAIGQGQLLITPLELASITQTIADKGVRKPPTLDPEGEKPEPVEVVDKEVAKNVGKAMQAVVTEGTGALAAIDGVRVAGKTGTAEVGLIEGVKKKDQPEDHAWFTAYAPADKPKLVVAVFVANSGFGGDIAAPVAAQVLSAGL
jgi:beta-lactamase class D